MKVGVLLFPTKDTIAGPELIRELNERNLDSLFVAEHSHIPKSTDRDLPRMYYEAMDPFVYLATAATVDSDIKLGTAICLVIQRDPIQTAKLVASLDVVSNGRFQFGVGAGWNEEEMQNHGTDPAQRFKIMGDRIDAMKVIWKDEVPEFQSQYVNFGPMESEPKPVQKPNPPILVGGGWPSAANRAIRQGDGWLPRSDVPNILERIPEFRQKAKDAGRDLNLTVLLLNPAEAKDYADAGVDRIIMGIPSAGREKVARTLDKYDAIANEFA